jgi:hypothetical protein
MIAPSRAAAFSPSEERPQSRHFAAEALLLRHAEGRPFKPLILINFL